jgi:hypothetical protein
MALVIIRDTTGKEIYSRNSDEENWEWGRRFAVLTAYAEGVSLRGAYLANIDLRSATLPGVDLTGADLGRTNLSYANLIGANLSDTGLVQTNLTGARLDNADLSGAYFHRTCLHGVDLSAAKNAPVVINWLRYPVLVYRERVTIGCQEIARGQIDEWIAEQTYSRPAGIELMQQYRPVIESIWATVFPEESK